MQMLRNQLESAEAKKNTKMSVCPLCAMCVCVVLPFATRENAELGWSAPAATAFRVSVPAMTYCFFVCTRQKTSSNVARNKIWRKKMPLVVNCRQKKTMYSIVIHSRGGQMADDRRHHKIMHFFCSFHIFHVLLKSERLFRNLSSLQETRNKEIKKRKIVRNWHKLLNGQRNSFWFEVLTFMATFLILLPSLTQCRMKRVYVIFVSAIKI